MIDRIVVKKNALNKKPIGCIAGSENDYLFKNTVIGYINEEIPIFIKTNMDQKQFDRFCNNELSKEEVLKFT